jgi:ribose-phosphate pyrophosphokinase
MSIQSKIDGASSESADDQAALNVRKRSPGDGSRGAVGYGLYGFRDTEGFARRLARLLGVPFSPVLIHRFPDGESIVRVAPAARRALVVRTLNEPNSKLFETLLAADALRRAGASHVTLIAPYLPYMRQDTVFRPGEPVSQHVLGKMLAPGFDAIFTIEAHLHRVHSLAESFGAEAQSLSAAPAIAQWVASRAKDVTLVGPDEESRRLIREIAQAAGVLYAVGEKRRRSDREVSITLAPAPQTRRAILVDDIASSGATLAAAARELHSAGVAVIDAAVVHAIFERGALGRIRAAGVGNVVSCDTIAHPTNAIRCAGIFAEALKDSK